MAICTPPGRASYICTYIYIYIPFVHIHTANTEPKSVMVCVGGMHMHEWYAYQI